MPNDSRAIAYDLDHESLVSLREALPEWQIDVVQGAALRPVDREWSPGSATLVVLGSHSAASETVGLCRALRGRAGWGSVPLLVLVPPEESALVRDLLDAGADSCLVLPVHPKQIRRMVAQAGDANHPGRHTLNLDLPQRHDENRDEGGEG